MRVFQTASRTVKQPPTYFWNSVSRNSIPYFAGGFSYDPAIETIIICTIKWLKIRQGLVKFEKKPYSTPFLVENSRHSWVSTVEPPDMWYSVTREAKVPVEIEVRDATLPFPWTNYPHGLGVTCDCLFSLMTIAKQAGYIWYYEYYIYNIYIYIYMILYDKHKHYDMYSILLHIYIYICVYIFGTIS